VPLLGNLRVTQFELTTDRVSKMNQRSRTGIGSAAKQWIMLSMVIVAAGLLLFFFLAKEEPRGAKIIREGDQAPEFRLSTVDGKQISLSDFRGKVVMVHFWATWCPPCVEEIPTLERVYRGFLGKDFELLAVNVDEGGAEAVTSFMQRNRLTLPVLLNPGGSVAKSYGTFKFPETYILDRNGIVRYKVIGPADWSLPDNLKAISDMIDQQ
jgi:peroxiredoxin